MLGDLHAEPGFLERVVHVMAPWLRRVGSIKEAIYLNALDPTRKDQRDWIEYYEDMLARECGEGVRFLPRKDVPRGTSEEAGPARDSDRIEIG